ncbi:UDP-glycosyltransferase 83A1-like isoform X2 [Vitis riparia]|uniref:UDP-glycosyltransferase 83A1-like isoform X2 n=1 Tax=Vitis riparia TaxID=96939 RepID=UPI00155ACF71|nr:UDP-glycosyltransferase 83A1-like isoform X2 [Vitis riparia]
MTNPHIVVVPAPKQGHVVPLMELSLCLVKHGFRVTFVNTLFNQEVIVSACKRDNVGNQLHLVSVQYGLGSDDHGRNDNSGKSTAEFLRALPKRLEELIEEIKGGGGGDEIACVVVDWGIGWILDVAAKMGIPRAAFYTASATTFALSLRIPKLISDGILNNDGDLAMQKFVFEIIEKGNKAVKEADWLFCNSTYEFEPEAFSLAPQMIPIGPLLASNRLGNSLGSLWPEDLTCLKWLDQQSPCSVIYVAFGSSTTNFNHNQFQELALGLELSNMPFLWVVRLNSTDGINDAYPEGFLDRVATRGKIVDWVPQQKVLSHPSVACFLSHCGWNSTMEGASNGLPFLCWPVFADQFINKSYICDVWKVGLGFDPDETEIVRREEIKNKVEQLLGDKNLKERASSLKEVASNSVREGGSSYSNFQRFTERLKADKGFFNTLFDCLCVPFTMRL